MKKKDRSVKTDEFIADLAHEIRTPIAIIKGTVDLALRSRKKDKNGGWRALRAVSLEARHVSNMLADLSLLTSEKKLKENKEGGVSVREVVLSAIRRCSVLARKKHISLKAKNMVEGRVVGDRFYLERLFVNLIKNTITYGRKSGLTTISMERRNKFVFVRISDNGVGISADDLPYIFDRFYRAEGKDRENRSGLGLAIAIQIAKSHKGRIEAESQLGKGSIFTVSLPIS